MEATAFFFARAHFASASELSGGDFLPDADVARNEIRLLERDVEFRFIGKLEREHFLHAAAGGRDFHQLEKPADAMLEVDHEIAFR